MTVKEGEGGSASGCVICGRAKEGGGRTIGSDKREEEYVGRSEALLK